MGDGLEFVIDPNAKTKQEASVAQVEWTCF
jgi:hypothetical protein